MQKLRQNLIGMLNRRKAWALSVALAFCSFTIGAQEVTVSGTITDAATNDPLIGVNIVVKGTTIGMISDPDGKYSITVPSTESVLSYAFIGYASVEQVVGNQTTIDVSLEETAINLHEVVAVGYGVMKKSDLTGAVASVDAEQLQKNSVATVDQALAGKVSGVYVTQNSGTPGAGASIRIRGAGSIGNSEPLYVIDGIPYSAQSNEFTSPLASLNMNDIESMEVLKDASAAAIYGARAANGVVLIKTKSGSNQKGKVSYSANYGVQNLAKRLEVMNGEEYATYRNAVVAAETPEGEEPVLPFENPSSFGAGTDWLDVVTNENAPTQTHQLSFSGGNERASSYMSLGYTKTEGTLNWSNFERYSFRNNSELKVNDRITAGTNISYVFRKQRLNDNDRGQDNSFLPRVLYFPPTVDAYDDNGEIADVPSEGGLYNPWAPPTWYGQYEGNTNQTKELTASIYGSLQIIQPLSFKTRITANTSGVQNTNNLPKVDLDNFIQDRNVVERSLATTHGYLYEGTLHFDKSFGKHNVSALAGASQEYNFYEVMQSMSQYEDEGVGVTNQNSPTFTFNPAIVEDALFSYFGRAFYNYDERYLLTAIIRYDGSGRLGPNDRTDVFPSLSGAWRVSNESFMKDINVITDLKVRAGWGQIGNESIGDYLYLSALASNAYYPFGNMAGIVSTGSYLSQVPNPYLKWETATTSYIGMDLILYKGKLALYADYYANKRENMLIGVPVSGITGQGTGSGLPEAVQNAGSLENKGIEIAIDHKNRIGELTYSVGANVTTIKNTITDLGNAEELQGYQHARRVWSQSTVGSGLGEFYGYEWDGVFQTVEEIESYTYTEIDPVTGEAVEMLTYPDAVPGDFIFRDIAGVDEDGNPTGPDGKIDENDQTTIGSPIPKAIYGLNLELGYKGFDFTMQFSGSYGNDVLNLSKNVLMDGSRRSANKPQEMTDFWDGAGSTNEYPRAYATDNNNNMRNSSYFVEDGSFFRCKLIQLGYTIPTTKVKSISNVRVFASVQNAFLFTKYSGMDPEVGNQAGESMRAGIDMFVYPNPRTFLVGFNVEF